MDLQLKNKTALVTGASVGIGRGIAKALAAEGVHVAISARRTDKLKELSDEIEQAGGQRPVIIESDLYAEDAAARLAKAALEGLGRVDILINNAGVDRPRSFLKATAEDIDLLVDVNLRAVLHLCRLVVPGMYERDRGHVVNISSIAGAYNFNGNSTYHATKAAVSMLSRQLRVDAFGKRVRVTEICPGRVATDIFAHVHGNSKEIRERFIDGFELPQAEDIADAIAFAIAAPIAVNVGHMEITPTLQVPGGLSTARPQSQAT